MGPWVVVARARDRSIAPACGIEYAAADGSFAVQIYADAMAGIEFHLVPIADGGKAA